MNKLRSFVTISAGLIVSAMCTAETITGQVIGVTDGDTLTVITSSTEQLKIRLSDIDAPEKNQAFGQRSKQMLSYLCYKKAARIEKTSVDRYGRTVGYVSCDGTHANLEQVKMGMAWVYDRYVMDKTMYAAQDSAKDNQLGLWSDRSPIPPWEWRHKKKTTIPKSDDKK